MSGRTRDFYFKFLVTCDSFKGVYSRMKLKLQGASSRVCLLVITRSIYDSVDIYAGITSCWFCFCAYFPALDCTTDALGAKKISLDPSKFPHSLCAVYYMRLCQSDVFAKIWTFYKWLAVPTISSDCLSF